MSEVMDLLKKLCEKYPGTEYRSVPGYLEVRCNGRVFKGYQGDVVNSIREFLNGPGKDSDGTEDGGQEQPQKKQARKRRAKKTAETEDAKAGN